MIKKNQWLENIEGEVIQNETKKGILKVKVNIGMLGVYLGVQPVANEGKRMWGWRSDWATQSYANKEAKTAESQYLWDSFKGYHGYITGVQKELRGADRKITCMNDHLLFQNYKQTDPKSSQK